MGATVHVQGYRYIHDTEIRHIHIPFSGKFSQDKIFADGSKNENSQIKFSWMLADSKIHENFVT